ncbi:MAG TPA: GTP cyclohydrolase I FolE2 [Halobacteriales archaeon]|uniref:GTP cyclohydrolase MptA n=1 Tax=Candidatus Hikarchaeum yamanae TaxID=2675326 RepID=UPI0017C3154D|nr:GTP cyclohydrolase I FolE2 [Halobacteriales archaeon]|tara:strand:+ start:17044 stop:17976 length:933 start_codon:yes stop_codon:yes gene_type:complete
MKRQELPDVQATKPEIEVGLNRVGVKGVKKLIEIERGGDRPYVLMATFEALVDLPGFRKGADMSRNMEVIDEILEIAIQKRTLRIEDICKVAADLLLDKHTYTTRAEVSMEAEFAIREETPMTKKRTQNTAIIIAKAVSEEEKGYEEIGAVVTGITVCPCSQEMMSRRAREKLSSLGLGEKEVEEFLEEVPQAGHSQRGHATLKMESKDSSKIDVIDLIEVARDSMSAKIFNLAKRPDEDYMTYHAHLNAKFVEDCVRNMAKKVVDKFEHLDDEVIVTMNQSNDESIHQHDAYAERIATMGSLRGEIKKT